MKTNYRFNLLRGSLLLCIVLPFCAAAAPPDRVVVFGDSSSDAGNFFLATGQFVMAPYEPIPAAPYDFRDNYRFSNGRVWIELLAGEWGIGSSAKAALSKRGHFTNYAFGRARARPDAPTFPLFDLAHQRGLFLADYPAVPSDALYVIWIGTNDVRDGLGALQVDPTGVLTNEILTNALTAIGTHIFELWRRGAQHFLVLNVPDLSITPAVRGLPEPVRDIAQFLSFSFNENLDATLAGLGGLPGTDIKRLNTFVLLNTVAAVPDAFGLINATDSCLAFLVAEDFLCRKPNRYLFFDAAHASATGHKILARAAGDLMSED